MSQLGLGYTAGPSNSAVAKNKHAPEMMINQKILCEKDQHLQMKIPDANETGSSHQCTTHCLMMVIIVIVVMVVPIENANWSSIPML
jgi:hypothetical protein